MEIAFDTKQSEKIASVLLQAQLDAVESIFTDSKFGAHVRFLLPSQAKKTIIGVAAHYLSMSYVDESCKKGDIVGETEWGDYSILTLTYKDQVFRFRRTSDENEVPRRSNTDSMSMLYNEYQGILDLDFGSIEPEQEQLHWQVVSGFQDESYLLNPKASSFYCWTAPFHPEEDYMIGNRVELMKGLAGDILAGSTKSGFEVAKPRFSDMEKEQMIEDAIKRANGE